jgi:hypothetical protein
VENDRLVGLNPFLYLLGGSVRSNVAGVEKMSLSEVRSENGGFMSEEVMEVSFQLLRLPNALGMLLGSMAFTILEEPEGVTFNKEWA